MGRGGSTLCRRISEFHRTIAVPFHLFQRRQPIKALKCRDVGFDCEAVVTAETIEEVLAQAAAHAQDVHGVTVTQEMVEEMGVKIEG